MQRVLSLEQAPPLSVPLRFFLTAPAFALAAALLLLWHGPDALVSRWSPLTLALTHLLTLGFLTMCMTGALLQLLPVVLGIQIPHARPVAGAAHILLTAGTALLCAAFVFAEDALFQLALPLLLTAFAWLFIAALRGVWAPARPSPMLTAIRFALAALLIAVALGAVAASAFAWRLPLPLLLITDVHAGWGLAGWVALLVSGIAYQVVPMFQVTPLYPALITRWLAKALFVLLAAWSLARTMGTGEGAAAWDWASSVSGSLLALLLLTFGVSTLILLWLRKRPRPDPTTFFWRTSMGSLIACTILWAAGNVYADLAAHPAYPLLLGVLFVAGFAFSVINGMLYKIVPFLIWYHLQNQLAGGCAKAPNVRQIMPDQSAERQYRCHLLALILLTAATLWPAWLARPAAVAFAASTLMLWWNLWQAVKVYRVTSAAHPVRESVQQGQAGGKAERKADDKTQAQPITQRPS